jgi:hypothetical protein
MQINVVNSLLTVQGNVIIKVTLLSFSILGSYSLANVNTEKLGGNTDVAYAPLHKTIM